MVLGSLLLMFASLGALYWSVLARWVHVFSVDPSYSHGFIVPFVVAILVYAKLRQLNRAGTTPAVSPNPSGYLFILLGCILLAIGERSTVTFITRLSFMMVVLGAIIAVLGTRWMKELSFPYAFTFFALPLPTIFYLPLSFRLQLISSAFAGQVLDVIGVPSLREGNIITLPNISLEVVEACSGVHSLFALLAIATLAGYLLLKDNRKRMLLALITVPLVIILNGTRITLTGVLSYYVGPEAAEGLAHLSSGLALAGLGCLIIFLVATRLQDPPLAKPRARVAPPEPRPRSLTNRRGLALGCLGISAMILTTMVFNKSAAPDRPQPLRQPLAAFPIELGGYQGRDIPLSRKALDNLGTDLAVMRDYRKAGVTTPINFYVIFYPSQQEHTSMHSPLHCIPGAGWETETSAVIPIRSKTFGEPFNINRVLFRNGEDRELVLYWYMEQGRPEHSEIGGALKTLWSGVENRRTDGCLIRVAALVVGSEQETLRQELNFLDIALPVLLQEFLPSAESRVAA